MKRHNSSEFKSLVNLLENNTSAENLAPDQRKRFHPRNLLKIIVKQGVGSGYLLTNDGYFITNDHVLPGETAQVYINKNPFPFKVQRTLIRSRPHDLVLAQINLDSDPSPTCVLLDDKKVRNGEKVRTYSFNEAKALRSHGKVVSYNYSRGRSLDGVESFLGGTVDIFDRIFNLDGQKEDLKSRVAENTCYSNCTIKPGWSGGPVVSESTGKVVGVTNSITSVRYLYDPNSLSQYHAFSSVLVVRTMIDRFLDGQIK